MPGAFQDFDAGKLDIARRTPVTWTDIGSATQAAWPTRAEDASQRCVRVETEPGETYPDHFFEAEVSTLGDTQPERCSTARARRGLARTTITPHPPTMVLDDLKSLVYTRTPDAPGRVRTSPKWGRQTTRR